MAAAWVEKAERAEAWVEKAEKAAAAVLAEAVATMVEVTA
jgi:hypothetical protein